jgi:hypothetical protein
MAEDAPRYAEWDILGAPADYAFAKLAETVSLYFSVVVSRAPGSPLQLPGSLTLMTDA